PAAGFHRHPISKPFPSVRSSRGMITTIRPDDTGKHGWAPRPPGRFTRLARRRQTRPPYRPDDSAANDRPDGRAPPVAPLWGGAASGNGRVPAVPGQRTLSGGGRAVPMATALPRRRGRHSNAPSRKDPGSD